MRDFVINCPFCEMRGRGPDTSRNLNVMPGGKVYHCFRCGARPKDNGTLPREILLQVGVECHGISKPFSLFQGVTEDDRGQITEEHSVFSCDECSEYLAHRGYSVKQFEYKSWLTGGWFLGHRIFFHNHSLGWWQGRAISPRNTKKYMTPPNFGRPGYIRIPGGTGDIVLVEGPFDALRLWTAGLRTIALCGMSYGDGKLEPLQRELWGERKIILCLDAEGTSEETMKWMWYLSLFVDVVHWPIQAKDPDLMAPEEISSLAKLAGA